MRYLTPEECKNKIINSKSDEERFQNLKKFYMQDLNDEYWDIFEEIAHEYNDLAVWNHYQFGGFEPSHNDCIRAIDWIFSEGNINDIEWLFLLSKFLPHMKDNKIYRKNEIICAINEQKCRFTPEINPDYNINRIKYMIYQIYKYDEEKIKTKMKKYNKLTDKLLLNKMFKNETYHPIFLEMITQEKHIKFMNTYIDKVKPEVITKIRKNNSYYSYLPEFYFNVKLLESIKDCNIKHEYNLTNSNSDIDFSIQQNEMEFFIEIYSPSYPRSGFIVGNSMTDKDKKLFHNDCVVSLGKVGKHKNKILHKYADKFSQSPERHKPSFILFCPWGYTDEYGIENVLKDCNNVPSEDIKSLKRWDDEDLHKNLDGIIYSRLIKKDNPDIISTIISNPHCQNGSRNSEKLSELLGFDLYEWE